MSVTIAHYHCNSRDKCYNLTKCYIIPRNSRNMCYNFPLSLQVLQSPIMIATAVTSVTISHYHCNSRNVRFAGQADDGVCSKCEMRDV